MRYFVLVVAHLPQKESSKNISFIQEEIMNDYLNSKNFPASSSVTEQQLDSSLSQILETNFPGSFFKLFGDYKNILADNGRSDQWSAVNKQLDTLFKCGKGIPLVDGPMIGVSMSIRDSDYFKSSAKLFGRERSALANMEWMASVWNSTFVNTGIWMGKSFEPVDRETVADKCNNNPLAMAMYDAETTRIGRNFFRNPPHPDLLQLAGMPVLTELWNLKQRPLSTAEPGFDGLLLDKNLLKEQNIPYIKTGGIFLANPAASALPEMNGKRVYQLNYRWPNLNPAYPMTRLVDELVQVDEGIYLGQLIMATKHYSVGKLNFSLFGESIEQELGEPYKPSEGAKEKDYGYQNNGFFLMIDPVVAKQAYADDAFPQLRPREGEMAYKKLGYDKIKVNDKPTATSVLGNKDEPQQIDNWKTGWQKNKSLRKKFTTFCFEQSPCKEDNDTYELLNEGESVLQMLLKIQGEISRQIKYEDHLRHFEKLHRLFRLGIAPKVVDGKFQGSGKGYNTRLNALHDRQWYGKPEPLQGFDYYHGVALNLHWGFNDTFRPDLDKKIDTPHFFPTSLATLLKEGYSEPGLLNMFWANMGRFIFPWAGKSFEQVSARKLSMLVDESDDLKQRYPQRVEELRNHLASWPHYDLVLKNEQHYWDKQGPLMKHLNSGSWDKGMSDIDKQFWEKQAQGNWVFGNNTQDERIVDADLFFRMLDMNYRTPEKPILGLTNAGPSPFVRQGYSFLGVADRESILPMNNGPEKNKQVFQFHYRYPMIGGPTPIGTCLDELVEIAEGLYLGQLIYSTLPVKPFNTAVDSKEYKYQLFGYFLLLDNDWESHRLAII